MAQITSVQASGFAYQVLPSGLQFLDNTLILSVKHIEGAVNARLAYNFQNGQWIIDRISYSGEPNALTAEMLTKEIGRIFEQDAAIYEEGTRLVKRIIEMNELDDEAFEEASERGDFDDIPFYVAKK
ncbi:hypothetical protein [Paenibacillus glycanilyticus]|uniref:Uncharacterized protein n=1 Tax=Paenibacillus glycanilyticus TaxID=126569 RepID=A0ABQ6GF38_9BACL|nr:hypothetical protein [Paenibacillus glycanilyticus]GLX68211.1 hypothetical protein MU1_25560 [Paenibacillus glycanilyticus]